MRLIGGVLFGSLALAQPLRSLRGAAYHIKCYCWVAVQVMATPDFFLDQSQRSWPDRACAAEVTLEMGQQGICSHERFDLSLRSVFPFPTHTEYLCDAPQVLPQGTRKAPWRGGE